MDRSSLGKRFVPKPIAEEGNQAVGDQASRSAIVQPCGLKNSSQTSLNTAIAEIIGIVTKVLELDHH